jgi:hypothetical protein
VKIRPTITEIRIAENLLKPGVHQYEACRAAGYSDSTSYTRSTEIINRPGVQTALAEALERAAKKQGKDNLKDHVAETMVAGMDATKKAHDGTVITDFTERRKSAETVATFAGMRPAAQLEIQDESYHDRILRLRGIDPEKVIEQDDDDE